MYILHSWCLFVTSRHAGLLTCRSLIVHVSVGATVLCEQQSIPSGGRRGSQLQLLYLLWSSWCHCNSAEAASVHTYVLVMRKCMTLIKLISPFTPKASIEAERFCHDDVIWYKHYGERFCTSMQKGLDRGRWMGLGMGVWLLWLAVERLWLALSEPFVSSFAQTGLENAPLK